MKKLLFFTFLSFSFIQAQFVAFKDKTSKNSFLGLDRSMCSVDGQGSGKNSQKAYDCGNNSVAGLLNLNFLDPSNFGQSFYMYNNFMYWIGQNLKSGNPRALSNSQPDLYFSGSGVFMIVISTNPFFKELIAPNKSCPAGQQIIMAQLKYNDGNSIAVWSQDAICCTPKDTFSIEISSEQDTTVGITKIVDDVNKQGIDWMKDQGPSAAYQKADSSPRKIRLVKTN